MNIFIRGKDSLNMVNIISILFVIALIIGFIYKSYEAFTEALDNARFNGIKEWKAKALSAAYVTVMWFGSIGTLAMTLISFTISDFLIGKEQRDPSVPPFLDPSPWSETILHFLLTISIVFAYLGFFLWLFCKLSATIGNKNLSESKQEIWNANKSNEQKRFKIPEEAVKKIIIVVFVALIFLGILNSVMHNEYWARITEIEPYSNKIILTVQYGEWVEIDERRSKPDDDFQTEQFYTYRPSPEYALRTALQIQKTELKMRSIGSFWRFETSLFDKGELRDDSNMIYELNEFN